MNTIDTEFSTQNSEARRIARAKPRSGILNSGFRILNSPPRSAFTLIEMLVAVALVVLMMSMFASIFQIATGSMGKQKGMAENDQRARTIVTVIKGDLNKRTYRQLTPIVPGLPNTLSDPDGQRGYFYISENNIADDTDDMFQFTIDVTRGSGVNVDKTPLYGRATLLRNSAAGGGADISYMFLNQNQPEFDDGQLYPDNAASSTAAEVSYFLRGNVLYRRTTLLRVPFSGNEAQPKDSLGNDLFGQNGGTGAVVYPKPLIGGNAVALTGANNAVLTGNSYWNDFDFSVFDTGAGISFLGSDALNNQDTNTLNSLGIPQFRFGHAFTGLGTGAFVSGITHQPREYIVDASNSNTIQYIGRFTHGETSHVAFSYPMSAAAAAVAKPIANPFLSGTALTFNAGTSTVKQFDDSVSLATGYAGGPRIGEDVLLTNVHSFDIKILDDAPGVMQFLDIGHSNTSGYYQGTTFPKNLFGIVGKLKSGYGPAVGGTTINNVFDTWHAGLDWNNDGVLGPPNFTLNGAAGIPIGLTATTATGADMPPYWAFDLGPDGAPGNVGDDDGDKIVDKHGPFYPPGHKLDNVMMPGTVADPLDGQLDAKEIGWPGSDDRMRPIRAIQIKIRYYDNTSKQLREVTIMHSLLD